MKRTPHLLAASHLVLMKNGSVLLQRRFQTGWMDGFYSLPAGHVEADESATTSMVREAKEEIGISLTPSELSFLHVMHRYADQEHQYIDFFYGANAYEGTPTIAEPEKCDDLSWFPLSALPNNIVPYIQEALQHIENGTHYSELNWS